MKCLLFIDVVAGNFWGGVGAEMCPFIPTSCVFIFSTAILGTGLRRGRRFRGNLEQSNAYGFEQARC